MIVAFSVTPLGIGEDVGEVVAEAVRAVRESGLPNRTDAMFTSIEGEWDEVMRVVKRAVDAVAARAPRVSLVLKADMRPGVTNGLTAKVEAVERYLNDELSLRQGNLSAGAAVLGLDELQKPPALAARGGCWFRGHGIELHLGVERNFKPARKAHPGLLVTGLDAWAGRLRDAGYPVLFDDEFPGMRRFYSEDPNGNRLEFLEPIRCTKSSD